VHKAQFRPQEVLNQYFLTAGVDLDNDYSSINVSDDYNAHYKKEQNDTLFVKGVMTDQEGVFRGRGGSRRGVLGWRPTYTRLQGLQKKAFSQEVRLLACS